MWIFITNLKLVKSIFQSPIDFKFSMTDKWRLIDTAIGLTKQNYSKRLLKVVNLVSTDASSISLHHRLKFTFSRSSFKKLKPLGFIFPHINHVPEKSKQYDIYVWFIHTINVSYYFISILCFSFYAYRWTFIDIRLSGCLIKIIYLKKGINPTIGTMKFNLDYFKSSNGGGEKLSSTFERDPFSRYICMIWLYLVSLGPFSFLFEMVRYIMPCLNPAVLHLLFS